VCVVNPGSVVVDMPTIFPEKEKGELIEVSDPNELYPLEILVIEHLEIPLSKLKFILAEMISDEFVCCILTPIINII
jgi:hypothetical protein